MSALQLAQLVVGRLRKSCNRLDHAIMDKKSAYCHIICTRLRRIAITSVARCVAYEGNEPLQMSVSYQLRYDTRLLEHGRSITIYTSSSLLSGLQFPLTR